MTRPFTGQRNFGIAAVTSVLVFGGSGSCAAGVTIAAVGVGAGAAGTEATFGARRGLRLRLQPRPGGLAAAACGARTPGMTMRSPIFTIVCGAMLLARAISLERLVILARQRHQRFAGRDDVDMLAAALVAGAAIAGAAVCGALRRGARRGAAGRLVFRDDQPLAGTQRRAVRNVVGLGDRRRRHAVARHQAVDGVALLHRDGGAALPVPAGLGGGLLRRRLRTEPVISLRAGAGS